MTFPDRPPGVVGWQPPTAAGGAATPRMHGQVDIVRALAESKRLIDLYERSLDFPAAPLFSGGVQDAWPAQDARALVICRQEHAATRAYEAWENSREAKRG